MAVATYAPQTVSYLDPGAGTQVPTFIDDLGTFTGGVDVNSGAFE